MIPQESWAQLIANGFEAFRQEHKITPAEIKLLNAEFPHYRNIVLTKLNGEQSEKQRLFRRSFRHLMIDCPPERCPQLFRDLLHMHVNRLFPEDPRTHEMVLCYVLDRELKMKKHTQQL